MSEMMIRRNNRGIPVARYPAAGKAEKTQDSAPAQKTTRTGGVTVSDTLRQLMQRVSQTGQQVHKSRQTLQVGEAVLTEVQESLERIGELAQEAAGGEATDRAALQGELKRLLGELDRMIAGASAGETRLFLDEEGSVGEGAEALLETAMKELDAPQEETQALPNWLVNAVLQEEVSPEALLKALGLKPGASGAEILEAIAGKSLEENAPAGYLAALYLGAVIAGGGSPEEVDPSEAVEGLRLLMEQVAGGVPLDEAIDELTGGLFTGLEDFEAQFTGGIAPDLEYVLTELLLSGEADGALDGSSILAILAELEGVSLEMMARILAAMQSVPEFPALGMGEGIAGEAAELAAASGPDVPAGAPAVLRFGPVQVVGQDLSGVRFQPETGLLTISGGAEVTLQGLGPEPVAVRMTGSGTVVLHNVNVSTFTVESAGGRVVSTGTHTLEQVSLQPGASLTLDGGGMLRLGRVQGDRTNTLRLAGGAVVVAEDREGHVLQIPVVMEGPASLAARAVNVRDAAGKPLEPFDLLWKTLLSGWRAVTGAEVDGQQVRMALRGGLTPDPGRLWLDKGDPSHGYPYHLVMLRGRDESGRPKVRYTYLYWNQNAGGFEEGVMYPNPFTVTGGEEDQDWVYEEATQMLRILTDQVSAISGGSGVDANQEPFSGRIALADGIGPLELTLSGVACQVASGRAFDLGRENDVTLFLQNGTDNQFESGEGFAGISLGEGTCLCVNRQAARSTRTPAGTLTATGGADGAGIGRDCGGSRDRTSRILIQGGVVTATGAGGGAGIGAGRRGFMGPVTITGGTVTSTGGAGGGAGIGGALGAPVGDISIRGGTISAAAVYHAAAIGAGVQGESGNIFISGTARIVQALGGNPGADIGACLFGGCGEVRISGGANIGRAKLSPHRGVALQAGEATVTLPQFRLSSRALRLHKLDLSTREGAQAAQRTVEADRQWVARIQAAYNALYSRLGQNLSGLHSIHRYTGGAEGKVRDTGAASTLLNETRRSILFQSAQTMHAYSKQSGEAVRQLLW